MSISIQNVKKKIDLAWTLVKGRNTATGIDKLHEIDACSAPDGITDEAEMVEPFTEKTAEKNASVKNTKDRFQVKTKPLTQKDIEIFFRPRSGPRSCVVSSDAEPVVSVSLYVEAMAALDEPVVAVSPDVEVMAALEELLEVMVVLEELVAQVETVGPGLPKRKRTCVPCKCTVPGPCCGRQFSSKKTLDVHAAKRHGDQTKANEKRAHANVLHSNAQKRRRREDPEWREKERVRGDANRIKKKQSLALHPSP